MKMAPTSLPELKVNYLHGHLRSRKSIRAGSDCGDASIKVIDVLYINRCLMDA
jgi:hypothetical protein